MLRRRIFKDFQLRWNEPLGDKHKPYARRWVFIAFGFSVRFHYWICSDDTRALHDHPWPMLIIPLWGHYTDITNEDGKFPGEYVGVGSVYYRPAEHRHRVHLCHGKCLTLVLTGRKIRNHGFYPQGKFTRPLRYFGKFGHLICEDK